MEDSTGTPWDPDYKYRISQGQRNLADDSPRGRRESDMTEATEYTRPGPPLAGGNENLHFNKISE